MTTTPPRKPWLTLLAVAGALLAALLALLATATVVVEAQLPELDELVHYQPRQPLEILSRDGVELGQFGPERRRFMPLSGFPPILKQALLATEDADFYHHGAISLKGIARAFVSNLFHRRVQGASTITQQVARNFFLSRKKSYSRKFAEALLAMKIERTLSKDQILELYMNQIYLGQRAYGFEAASLTYFGKPSAQLDAAEAAMLAGLPQNPRGADPVEHHDKARARQLVVLQRMHETGVLDDTQYQQARAEKLHIIGRWTPPVSAEFLSEMVRKAVVERFGETAAYSQGLRVTTSVDAADQAAAHAAVRRAVLDYERRQPWRGPEDSEDLPDDDTDIDQAAAAALRDHPDDDDLHVAIVTHASPRQVTAILASGETVQLSGEALRLAQPGLRPHAPDDLAVARGSIIRVMRTGDAAPRPAWRIAQWPDAQAALVSMDPATGQLRALVGGFDFSHSQFNHVTSAWRQPGSSFKPFLYSAALEHGVQAVTVVNDAPLSYDFGGQHWEPKNDDNEYDGPITLRTALAKSKNVVSVRLLQVVGIPTVKDWAGRFGLTPAKQPDNLTLALGAGSVTPLQMVRAYAAFANGGYAVTPRFIEKITDASGKVLYQAPPLAPLAEAQRVIPARNAFVMTSLLGEVTRSGTGARAQAVLKRPDIYGKTGTTNDAVDTWFAGFQPHLATVVWMGKDDNTSMGTREFGATLALPIWIDYMRQALRTEPVLTPDPPPGVHQVGGDWLYDEYDDGGYIAQIGMDPSSPVSVTMAPRAGEAASGPAIAPAPTSSAATLLPPLPPPPALPPPSSAPAAAAKASTSGVHTVDPLERLPPSLR